MTDARDTSDAPDGLGVSRACPYLGLRGDPATHLEFVSGAQVCHAGHRPMSIDAATQARDCLTDLHVHCPRYRPVAVPGTNAVASPDEDQERGLDHRAGGARRTPRLILPAALLVAIALAGVVIGSQVAARLGSDTGGGAVLAKTGRGHVRTPIDGDAMASGDEARSEFLRERFEPTVRSWYAPGAEDRDP